MTPRPNTPRSPPLCAEPQSEYLENEVARIGLVGSSLFEHPKTHAFMPLPSRLTADAVEDEAKVSRAMISNWETHLRAMISNWESSPRMALRYSIKRVMASALEIVISAALQDDGRRLFLCFTWEEGRGKIRMRDSDRPTTTAENK